MGKLIKWLTISVLVVAILVTVAALIFVNVFDPNDYKAEISALVKDKTGRELHIGEDIGLTLFPRLGVELRDVTLANPPGFDKGPFAHVDDARVSVRIVPLLSKRIEVDTITVDGLDLRLQRNRDGLANWDDLLGGKQASEQAGEESGNDAALIGALRVGGLDIRDLAIDYRDLRAGTHHTLALRRLSAGEIAPGRNVPLELEVSASSDRPAMEAGIEASGTLQLGDTLQRFTLPDLRARLRLSGDDLPKQGISADLSAALFYDNAAHSLRLDKLLLTRKDLKLSGELRGDGLDGSPRTQGHLSAAPFALRDLLAELGVALDTADPRALERAAIELDVEHSGTLTRIEDLKLQLDDSKMTGKASFGTGDKAPIRFDLKVDQLDLDRYLPPAKTASAPSAAQDGSPAPLALPLKRLRRLDLDGRLHIDRLRLRGLRMEKAVLALHASKGVIQLKPLAARLYGGSLRVDAAMNVRGKQPAFSLNQRLKRIDIGPLLKDATGETPLITGAASLFAKLQTRGLADADLRRHLNGNAGFSFSNGALHGFDLAAIIRQAQAALKGQRIELSGPQKTDFAEMKGSLRIRDGIARNDDLSLKSPLLRVRGKGKIDLPNERLDYLVTAKLVGSLKGQGGADIEKLKGVPIPVRIRGPFRDPSIQPDLESIVEEAAKRKLLDKVKEKAGGKLDEVLKKAGGSGLGDALQGLFK